MSPQISIVIPVCNAEKYIKRCIDSVVSQSFQNFEIVIVNNGSTDDTKRICEEIAEKDCRVFFYDTGKNNKGVSYARNLGIQKSTGEYISFVDADDILQPDMLEVLWNQIQVTGALLAGCSFFQWRSSGDIPKQKYSSTKHTIKTYPLKEYIENGILAGDTRCWSKLYHRSCVKDCRFDETLSIGEDMFFLLTLITNECDKNSIIAITEYQGYGYFCNKNGAINRAFNPGYLDQIRCWQKADIIISHYMPEQSARVKTLTVIGAMLTVGKIALLPMRDREKSWVDFCYEAVKSSIKRKKVFSMLSRGYRIKVIIFLIWPQLYISAYHVWKKRGLH